MSFLPTSAAQPNVAKMVNDAYADLVAKNPRRFKGFASIPMDAPDAALKELHRAIDTSEIEWRHSSQQHSRPCLDGPVVSAVFSGSQPDEALHSSSPDVADLRQIRLRNMCSVRLSDFHSTLHWLWRGCVYDDAQGFSGYPVDHLSRGRRGSFLDGTDGQRIPGFRGNQRKDRRIAERTLSGSITIRSHSIPTDLHMLRISSVPIIC